MKQSRVGCFNQYEQQVINEIRQELQVFPEESGDVPQKHEHIIEESDHKIGIYMFAL